MLYVDTVVNPTRYVERGRPAFKGWTSKMLNDREFAEIKKGGFGLGNIELALETEAVMNEDGGNGSQHELMEENQEDEGDDLVKAMEDRFEKGAQQVIQNVKDLTTLADDAGECTIGSQTRTGLLTKA
ncbi:PREDICTED: uncharacterized protein LOC109170912 [Ipomoea nil]|uniref:uncharacterized protein LOC109170912 n=1 Tax=Ipomoea nil TaxID=35883 RepID=UPI000901EF0F|nr:PREDICTED: uncharacterized protein LOC109170912 [Ipomoea nil]